MILSRGWLGSLWWVYWRQMGCLALRQGICRPGEHFPNDGIFWPLLYASSRQQTVRPWWHPIVSLISSGTLISRFLYYLMGHRTSNKHDFLTKRDFKQESCRHYTFSFLIALCRSSSGKKAYRSWCNLLRTIDNCHSLLIPSASDGKEKWLHGEVRGYQAQTRIFLRVSHRPGVNWKHDVKKRTRAILVLWVIQDQFCHCFCSFFSVESWV